MFGTLKAGSLLYIINKGENPSLAFGQVLSVSAPRAKIGSQFMGINPMQMEQVVDISVKVGDDTKNFSGVSTNLNIIDTGNGGYIISDDKTAITNEVERLGTFSQNALDSIPFHKKMVTACKQMMLTLNPTLKKESERDEEMANLRKDFAEMKGMMTEFAKMLKGASSNNNLFGKE